jgi:hypothetical protein
MANSRSSPCSGLSRLVKQIFSSSLFMMKHSYIRSFHASHQLNLQPMDNEREYLPWMSDYRHTQSSLHFHSCDASADEIEQIFKNLPSMLSCRSCYVYEAL